jgi:flagellar basal body rod protein FlgB
MKLKPVIADNITELLTKIIEFTHLRQKILSRNIDRMHTPGFVPQDMPVAQFAELLTGALQEHVRTRRLVLRDADNIKFGQNGTFKASPTVDSRASRLLQYSKEQYLEFQIDKLFQNSLNQRLAAELLRQQQGMAPIFE